MTPERELEILKNNLKVAIRRIRNERESTSIYEKYSNEFMYGAQTAFDIALDNIIICTTIKDDENGE